MLYLNDGHIREIGIEWPLLIDRIESTLRIMGTEAVSQPLKPYLRYGNPANRIIAMPAYVGGDADISGIKWIASFPGNLARGKPRAHSAIVLNDPADGVPVAIINGGLLSELRTAAVSAIMLREYMKLKRRSGYRVGVIGWGPIGRSQIGMLMAQHGAEVDDIRLFDLRGIEPQSARDPSLQAKAVIVPTWQEAYWDRDIVFTCTSSAERYIDEPPQAGALLMNISLREYTAESSSGIGTVVVDDWREVCRENTDIELLHLQAGLTEKDTTTLREVAFGGALRTVPASEPIFFNPMGMAAFDLALAAYYWREAMRRSIGVTLED
ncbi:2,3-diaminopropionate biosynthesis protein SbnB [Cohnella endophytica]|uniref:2,3-diaminopropionate biosynthesis protein SbnB n=1 Tax=Cohnella endophytica TaxID=2419778 RepID=A0A494XEE5_9BACL|nr:2,3-diaminopropionate biosynthesis protein SbnB [Cohnella endophytica]RKP48031.1 2,3-diaminopropionate biosynthesis protein SbnB [Cohnella endophytica]